MSIRFTPYAPKLSENDPFVLSEPCWQVPVLTKLPSERNPINDVRLEAIRRDKLEMERIMAIRQVAITDTPLRLHRRTGLSSAPEFSEVLNAMSGLPKDKNMVVDLNPDNFKDEKGQVRKDYEVAFSGTLRRHFVNNNILATAYHSGKNQIVVTRVTAHPKGKATKKKSS
jgi:hypothetical protein